MNVNRFVSSDMSHIAENAITLGLNDLEQEFYSLIAPSIEEVRQAGLHFCQLYEESLLEKNRQDPRRKSKKTLLAKIQLNTGVREAFDKFQNITNLYFNQMMKVMYVYMDPATGKVDLSVIDNNTAPLIISHYGSVQYQLAELKNVFKIEDYDSRLLDATEQSIYARWQIAKDSCRSGRFLPILWKTRGTWKGARVNNLGTVAEAYVNFYIAKYSGFTSNLEENVEDYVLNDTLGMASVDNMSGFLIGDASYNNIQFAVKKESASPMNIKQVYDKVNEIIRNPAFNPEILKTIFVDQEKESSKKNQVKQLLEYQLAETGNKILANALETKLDIGIQL